MSASGEFFGGLIGLLGMLIIGVGAPTIIVLLTIKFFHFLVN